MHEVKYKHEKTSTIKEMEKKKFSVNVDLFLNSIRLGGLLYINIIVNGYYYL